MKILNRFLLAHFLRILSLSGAAFVGIYLLIDFFENVSDFIDHKAVATDYFSYLFNSIPFIFVQILPLAILMSVVLTLGTLGRTNEVTAMRACGVSLWRIVRPLMMLALCLSIFQMALNEFVVPFNTKMLNDLKEIKLKGKQLSLKRNELWYRDKNRIINIRVADPVNNNLHGVTIFIMDDSPKIVQRQEIQKLEYRDGRWSTPFLTEWQFDTAYGDLKKVAELKNQQVDINREPNDFTRQAQQNNSLTFRELWQTVGKLDSEGIDSTHHRVEMHSRLAAPFTCLIMAFLGVPFALQRGRNSNIALGIGLSLSIGVVYFILQSLVTAFGYSGALPPILSAWAPNIIFLMVGVWMLLSVKE
ncbi:lipopolysaccharide export system permease protein [Malonomonas rubra DSM 5091]|uniref:Lipopolysaccharide export system permease protein n=1 Tax=Malonomonas rubra DSM 5091 TaxID=1122189 RepID=A0A1M6BRL2_MALRU|nr:LPS export ABC transporter permease LptG [Malonomonas rubra]SHI51223.1 lipopolysaccharide export system permease protein [Malonomonas rubra DSM 5091]